VQYGCPDEEFFIGAAGRGNENSKNSTARDAEHMRMQEPRFKAALSII
jgi:hypothetical protein